MKKILSIQYGSFSFNTAILLLRVVFGGTMLLNHGWVKLTQFSDMLNSFNYSFMGLSPKVSFIMLIFAEFFCSIFVIIGLFTRLTALPLVVAMGIAFMGVHKGNFQQGEIALLYFSVFTFILLCGPGKVSMDKMIGG